MNDSPTSPPNPAASSTPVLATQPTDIVIWPTGAAPDGSTVNPVPGAVSPNAATATLHTDGTFQMQNKFGTVHVVIDVDGHDVDHNHDDRYETESEVDERFMSAVIDDDGPLTRGSGAVAASRTGVGRYTVDFGRDVTTCTYGVTLGPFEPNIGGSVTRIASVEAGPTTASVAVHVVRPTDGASVDHDFQLIVLCQSRNRGLSG